MQTIRWVSIAALAATLALSGCASMGSAGQPQTVWVRPNSSGAELVQDRNACMYDAHKAAPYAAPDSLPVVQLAIECLKAKGWQLVPVAAANE